MLEFILSFTKLFSVAQTLANVALPVLAEMRKTDNASVTNAGISNTLKAINAVAPIVQAVDTHSASLAQPMSGADKLATAQAIIQSAHDSLTAAGEISQPFDAYWPLANAAITAICATGKQATPPVAVQTPVDPFAAAGIVS